MTTWVLLTQLAWKIEQWVFMPLQSQVLQVVLEWCGLLLAWLCVGVYEWCKRQDEPSTHSLLATKAPGRSGAGPLLRSRLAQKKNIRGARREWREDGAKWTPGSDSVLRQVCGAHLIKVRQTFAHAPVIELCFDASQVSIRNHDIFAVYAYECHTSTGSMATGFGASTSSEGTSTYLPPVRVPELAWREGDADEALSHGLAGHLQGALREAQIHTRGGRR